MSSELTVIQPAPLELAPSGGMGLDFNSPLFRLKALTLTLNQSNTSAEGAIPGKLRVSETGQQYDDLFVTLLEMPVEQRAYYEGEAGTLHRTPDNLMCMCRNVTRDPNNPRRETSRPDAAARVPQALKCEGCGRASWDKWNKSKTKDNIPPCDLYYLAILLDTRFKMPFKMYIRSKNKKPFEDGMENLSRTFRMMMSEGLKPNIFDIGFKLSTRKIITNKLPSYVLNISDVMPITPEQRKEFGAIYLEFANRSKSRSEESDADQIDNASNSIDAQVSPGGPTILEGEIVI